MLILILGRFNVEVVGGVGDGDDTLVVEGPGEMWPHQRYRIPLIFHPKGPGNLQAQISCSPALEVRVVGKATSILVTASCCETRLTVRHNGSQ